MSVHCCLQKHTRVLVLDENSYNIKTRKGSAEGKKNNERFLWLAFRTTIWGSSQCLPEAPFLIMLSAYLLRLLSLTVLTMEKMGGE